MLILSWMWRVGPKLKVLTVNGWHARSLPFEGTDQILLQSLSPFAMFLEKAGVLYHLSSGQICHTPIQDPLH